MFSTLFGSYIIALYILRTSKYALFSCFLYFHSARSGSFADRMYITYSIYPLERMRYFVVFYRIHYIHTISRISPYEFLNAQFLIPHGENRYHIQRLQKRAKAKSRENVCALYSIQVNALLLCVAFVYFHFAFYTKPVSLNYSQAFPRQISFR